MQGPIRLTDRARAIAVLASTVAGACALLSARADVSAGADIAPATATLVTVAGWAVWLLVGYALAVLGVASACVFAGHPRQAATVLRLNPAFLRRALGAVLGVALTASPAVAAVSPARSPGDVPPAPIPARAITTDPLDWSAPPGAASAIDAAATPAGGRAPTPQRSPATPPMPVHWVRVRAGDCLWTLAARDLAARRLGSRPAEIGAAWHRWYAVNRRVIGPDPRLLHPSELLRVPPPSSSTHPSTHVLRRPS
jgi:hypothetical protein